MRRSQYGLIAVLAVCIAGVILSVRLQPPTDPVRLVEPVAVFVPPVGDEATLLDPVYPTSNSPDAPESDLDARTSIAKVPETFDLRAFRSKAIERLHGRFVATKKDTDDEWQAGYMLMQTSLLAHLDHTGGFTDGGGKGFTSTGNDPDTFRTYSDGREYVWRKCDYPELAEMTAFRFEQPSPGSRRLTVPQRQAVGDLFALARTELAAK